MPLRIGFDVDGVLADMEAALAREAVSLFGDTTAPSVESPSATADEPASETLPTGGEAVEAAGTPLTRLELSSRQTRRLWQHVETIENFWESLDELEPGVIARLAATGTDRRWEIIFLTRRPGTAGATAQLQTQRWLESKGFSFPSVYVVQGSRGRIAAALDLDFVIDDRPENCLDVVVDSRARAILVWRGDEEQLPEAAKRLGIGVVGTVAECLDILAGIDASPAAKPGVIDRVKKMLGLGEPS